MRIIQHNANWQKLDEFYYYFIMIWISELLYPEVNVPDEPQVPNAEPPVVQLNEQIAKVVDRAEITE